MASKVRTTVCAEVGGSCSARRRAWLRHCSELRGLCGASLAALRSRCFHLTLILSQRAAAFPRRLRALSCPCVSLLAVLGEAPLLQGVGASPAGR